MVKILEKAAIGTFCHLMNSNVAECLCLSGLDYFIADTEHAAVSDEQLADIIRVARLYEKPTFVRIKEISRSAVLHSLDIGAAGIIIPNIQSELEVQKLIEFAKFYPLGNRGFAFTMGNQYGENPLVKNIETYFQYENAHTLLLPQCETKAALEKIEKIVSLDGVDGIFIGPYDLSIDLGVPGKINAPILLEAVLHVQRVCEKYGKLSFIYGGNALDAKKYFSQGFSAVAIGTDATMLMQAYQNILQKIRQ